MAECLLKCQGLRLEPPVVIDRPNEAGPIVYDTAAVLTDNREITATLSLLQRENQELSQKNRDLSRQLYHQEYKNSCLEKQFKTQHQLLVKEENRNKYLCRRISELETALADKEKTLKQVMQQRDKLSHQVSELLKERGKLKDLEELKAQDEEQETVQAQEPERAKKRPGARPGHPGWYRKRPEHIDRIIEIRPGKCDGCGSEKIEEGGVETHVQEELIIRRQVTEYRRHWGKCLCCGKIVRGWDTEEIKSGRIGPNALALAALLKIRMGVPYEKISWLLSRYGVSVTNGGLCEALRRISHRLEPIHETILNVVRNSSVIGADETGWPISGIPNWAWCFPSEEAIYYTFDKSRGSKVVERVLGDKINGVLCTDFYSAYNRITAKKQKCLVHLLRDIKKYLSEPGTDKDVLEQLKSGLKQIIEQGKELSKSAGTGYSQGMVWQLKRQEIEEVLVGLCNLNSEDKLTQNIIKRINKHRGSLLTFVDNPGVEPDNNRTERKIRPIVVFRKISQGSRTERGAQTTAVLISILETARERNVDFADLLKLSLVVGTTRKQITGKLFNNKGISAKQAAELEIIGGQPGSS